ncbi:MAG: F0F1 ATP synthase subunit A [Bacteroidales bacterium]|nr:F0F1 ATP synthase subunit A [Bacteroidales bacterium]
MKKKKIIRFTIAIVLVLGFFWSVILPKGFASHPSNTNIELSADDTMAASTVSAPEEKSKLDIGTLIIEEVIDAHEWHFATLPNGHAIAMHLPIIAFSEGKLFCFSSKHLEHGETYKGFLLSEEVGSRGKLQRYDAEGNMMKIWDFSITRTVMGVFISCLILILVFTAVARSSKRNEGKAPTGLQNAMEPLIVFVRSTAISNIGEKHYEKFMPYLLTLFFFIFLNNLFGRVPLYPNTSGNIAVALVMAVFTFLITCFSGNKHYWKDIFNPDVPWWLKSPLLPLMPVIEFVGMFTKPFVLTVRLFANITGGHIVSLSLVCLIFLFGEMFNAGVAYGTGVVAVLFGLFISFIEILVAFIQAYVFTLLSSIYFGTAVEEPKH